jgi:hypothetical protein
MGALTAVLALRQAPASGRQDWPHRTHARVATVRLCSANACFGVDVMRPFGVGETVRLPRIACAGTTAACGTSRACATSRSSPRRSTTGQCAVSRRTAAPCAAAHEPRRPRLENRASCTHRQPKTALSSASTATALTGTPKTSPSRRSPSARLYASLTTSKCARVRACVCMHACMRACCFARMTGSACAKRTASPTAVH